MGKTTATVPPGPALLRDLRRSAIRGLAPLLDRRIPRAVCLPAECAYFSRRRGRPRGRAPGPPILRRLASQNPAFAAHVRSVVLPARNGWQGCVGPIRALS